MSSSLKLLATASLACGALLAVCMAPAPVAAQSSVRVELGADGAAARKLSLPRGKSAIVDLPIDARDVLVSNPAVADAVLRTQRRIYVMGLAPGQTDAVFFDAAGRRILSLDIRVDQPTGALEDTIRRVAPNDRVHVEAVNDSIVLTGSVASAAESERIQRLAERFVAKPELVMNMLDIRGAQQVMLKVRVVEMQRTIIKQLGFNTNAIINQAGMSQLVLGNVASFAVNNGLLGGFSSGYQQNTTTQPEMIVPCAAGVSGTCSQIVHGSTYSYVGQDGLVHTATNGNTATVQNTAGSSGLNKAGALMQAFERTGLVRTLAEPNLTAVSGESAKFLAGGEFPVPTGVDQNGNVTVTFKPFGVGLAFTPVVLSGGRISLRVSTEVSELTSEGALKFNSSLSIPSLSVRRAETTVEMPSGGALMMAGLLKEQTRQDIDGVPGLAEVPVLGSLFRSRDYQAGETELVIIVEPYLVEPTSPDSLQTPVDGLQIASDMDTIFRGSLNKAYGEGKGPAPRGGASGASGSPAAGAWNGPVGYVID